MPPPEKEQLTVRLSPETLARLDKIAKKLSRPGLELKRADALRIAVETGLGVLEKD